MNTTLTEQQIPGIIAYITNNEPDVIILGREQGQSDLDIATTYIKDELECQHADGIDITEQELINSLIMPH